MHAENLLLLLDELDELQIAARECLSWRAMAFMSAMVLAIWVTARTASPALGLCLLVVAIAMVSLLLLALERLRPALVVIDGGSNSP